MLIFATAWQISVLIDHVLKQILPPGVEVPSSFETIVKYLIILSEVWLVLLYWLWILQSFDFFNFSISNFCMCFWSELNAYALLVLESWVLVLSEQGCKLFNFVSWSVTNGKLTFVLLMQVKLPIWTYMMNYFPTKMLLRRSYMMYVWLRLALVLTFIFQFIDYFLLLHALVTLNC